MISPDQATMINCCYDHLASIPLRHHKFIIHMKELLDEKPYWNLSKGQRPYLQSIYNDLVHQGVVPDMAEAG